MTPRDLNSIAADIEGMIAALEAEKAARPRSERRAINPRLHTLRGLLDGRRRGRGMLRRRRTEAAPSLSKQLAHQFTRASDAVKGILAPVHRAVCSDDLNGLDPARGTLGVHGLNDVALRRNQVVKGSTRNDLPGFVPMYLKAAAHGTCVATLGLLPG